MSAPTPDLPKLLRDIFDAALAAVEPGGVLTMRLEQHPLPDRPPHILALGKAAPAMARGAVDWLKGHKLAPAGGVIVGPADAASPHVMLRAVHGDHPEPRENSARAAAALQGACNAINPGDKVFVLLSGGSSSLVGAPVDGMTDHDYQELCRDLLGSGLSIQEVNRIRKRYSRWGAGRLAAALEGAEVEVMVVSDVFGDDFAAIGSGPCVGDPATAEVVRNDLIGSLIGGQLPPSLFIHLEDVIAGRLPETPKPAASCFRRVTHEVIASNRMAVQAAAARAEQIGFATTAPIRPIVGEAALVGRQLADTVLKRPPGGPWCAIWGGEATVTLGAVSGQGGRCQEIALAAAERFAQSGSGRRIALLAAGTDGRDGPTDAAGAIVTPETWGAIKGAGLDPSKLLAQHDSYPALDAAKALLRPGLTGTNVNDVVVAVEI
jgi:glycerate 2-kinase